MGLFIEVLKMTLTSYRIFKERDRFTVYENKRIISYGFMSVEEALKSVWVIEGSDYNTFFHCHNGIVSKTNV